MDWKKIAYAEEQIEIYLAAIEQQDGTNVSIKEKLEAYQQLKEKYETQREELRTEGLEQKILTDPDSRRMKNNGALDICYNVQAAIDGSNHFAIDAVVTNDINDLNHLSTMAADAKELVEPDEMAVTADTGYYNAPEIKNCVDAGISVYIKKSKSNNQTKENGYRKDKFIYDSERDVYTCPEGKELHFLKTPLKTN